MDVVRRADDYRVNALLLLQHVPEIAIGFGVGIPGEGLGGEFEVHVGQGDNVLAFASRR